MRKLTWTTVGITYFLMFWGNLVSATGSGLGCPDWPTCHGGVTPPLYFEVFFEWGHRLIAAAASVMIITTVVRILRSGRTPSQASSVAVAADASAPGSDPALRRSAKSLVALLTIQILLGGTTVLLGLSIAVSTIHLLVASVVFCGLISLAAVATWRDRLVVPGQTKLRRFAQWTLAAFVMQLALGALVRHGHAGLACPRFPLCADGFFPSYFQFEPIVAFLHRWWGILMAALFFHISMAARRTPLRGLASVTAFLALAQVGLGIGTVMMGLDTVMRAVHAALGYALWGSLYLIALRSGGFRWVWDSSRKTPSTVHPVSLSSPLAT